MPVITPEDGGDVGSGSGVVGGGGTVGPVGTPPPAPSTDDIATYATSLTALPTVSPGDEISATLFTNMLNILNDVVQHNHTFYDDYSTACNCNGTIL